MSNPFFDHPILNSPYERPRRHWELDAQGQPTQQIVERRRRADFITPIPKPKKRKAARSPGADHFRRGQRAFDQGAQYNPTSIINEVRQRVDAWRTLPQPSQWQVTPETARLLEHWRHHKFSGVRPFFCQMGAAENSHLAHRGRSPVQERQALLDHLASANRETNPELMRFAL